MTQFHSHVWLNEMGYFQDFHVNIVQEIDYKNVPFSILSVDS